MAPALAPPAAATAAYERLVTILAAGEGLDLVLAESVAAAVNKSLAQLHDDVAERVEQQVA